MDLEGFHLDCLQVAQRVDDPLSHQMADHELLDHSRGSYQGPEVLTIYEDADRLVRSYCVIPFCDDFMFKVYPVKFDPSSRHEPTSQLLPVFTH